MRAEAEEEEEEAEDMLKEIMNEEQIVERKLNVN